MMAPATSRRGPLSEDERAWRLRSRRRRAEERRLYALAREIVTAGYRVVASKYHPDRGGQPETFIRVGQLRHGLLLQLPDPRSRRRYYGTWQWPE